MDQHQLFDDKVRREDTKFIRSEVTRICSFRALHHYAREVDGPYSSLAEEAYVKLRKAVVENVIREYKR